MTTLYPIKFNTIFKDKIWGGTKIHSVLGKDFSPLPNCGETWEVSGVERNISQVAEGELAGRSLNELVEEYGAELVGRKVFEEHGDDFPLLIKYIDANDDLSIQVHPDDKLAKKRHNGFGKTEMWYILDAEPGSFLYNGFSQKISPEEYQERIEDNTILEVLNKEYVEAGDVFFIPAGRVHSIGKGIMIAEIQQTSDITYRIYDFDRKDDKGVGRQLHTEESKDALDYELQDAYKTRYELVENSLVPVVESPYFSTSVLSLHGECKLDLNRDSFTILMGVEGNAVLECNGVEYSLNKGEVILLPASISNGKLFSDESCRIVETFVP